jgi:hypothetical protein
MSFSLFKGCEFRGRQGKKKMESWGDLSSGRGKREGRRGKGGKREEGRGKEARGKEAKVRRYFFG